jgi:hypothetical protein
MTRCERFGDDVSDHKFKVGLTVHYTPGRFGRARPGDVKVIQHLPPEDGEYRYRVKSADEPFDRVVKENELERVM